jgi:hypothetical protein
MSRTAPVIWYVVCGASPDSVGLAVDPGPSGVSVPDEILDWATGHGLSLSDPDVYVLVTDEENPGPVTGQVASREGTVTADEAASISAARAEEVATRAGA